MKTEVCPVCRKVGSGSLGGKCSKCGASVIGTNMPFGEYLNLSDERKKKWVESVLSRCQFDTTEKQEQQVIEMANVCPQCGLVESGVGNTTCSRCNTAMVHTDTAYSQYQEFDRIQAKTWRNYILDEYQKDGGVVNYDRINSYEQSRPCPHCGATIYNVNDRFCYSCGESLTDDKTDSASDSFREEPECRLTVCPDCKNQVSDTAKVCPHCGREMKGKPTQPYFKPGKVNDACKVTAIIIVLVGIVGGGVIGDIIGVGSFFGVAAGSVLLALLFWSIGEIIELLQILIEQNRK